MSIGNLRVKLLKTGFGQLMVCIKHNVKQFFKVTAAKIRGFDDFFEFPFDVSQPMPPTAQEELATLINFLNSEGIEYWLAEGTLLGIVRDAELITHDTDLDFYLTSTKDIDNIGEFLIHKGYSVGRLLKHRNKLFQITFYNEDNLLVDFLIWGKCDNGDLYWVGPEISGKRVQSATFFDSSCFLTWRELRIRTFCDYRRWLAMVYGDGWTVPETKKSDWTKTIGDLE